MSHHNRRALDPDVASIRVWTLIIAGIVAVLVASTLPAATADAASGVGSFRVACGPSHDGVFDPIVFPGQSPAGHQHEFYGSTATGPSSTSGSLLGSSTTCSDSADSSGYWHPSVFFNGVRTPASLASVYYTQRSTKKPVADVQVWPAGLRVIAGDMHAQNPQSDFIVWWDCDGATMDHQPTAPTCPTSSRGLEANVRFPDCWDGVNLDSADHKSHMSYSANDGSGTFRCDAAHPVALPYVHMIFRWDGQYPAGESVTLSSGSGLGFHADFMNGWSQTRLVSLTTQCIMTSTECGRIDDGSQPSVAVTTAPPPTTVTTAKPAATTATTAHNHSTTVTTRATTATTGATTATTAPNHSTTVTNGPTTATTTHNHTTTTSAASSPPATEMNTVSTDALEVTTMAAGSGSEVASNASEPLARDISGEGSGSNVGAVAAVFGLVILAGGLWVLARWGFNWLRGSFASPNN